ncbi:GPI ethanolamine phosphate transferase 3 [Frankliniella fusca]|uniref:GPI ethanolamine phosphate transferase 3, catalytic subunit n=1 Tax=Frankliniella fusca TaxID=407009 RepID=A0AAE1LQU3_9NEOP|nr:GPI ethanolamine phosphate transferase 3 [Frankliniella fusca]
MSKFWRYFLFLAWMSYLLVCGVLLFSRGFLLRRQVQPEKSRCIGNIYCSNFSSEVGSQGIEADCVSGPSPLNHLVGHEDLCSQGRAKVVLVVVDALKYDFAYYHSTQNPRAYENRLTILKDLIVKQPDNTRLYKFIADPPTTTMQRLKGLTTGSLPTFIDIGSNFASTEINEDNLIDQLRSKGKKAVFMGDDTWVGLYPHRFEREYPFLSFNVWDLDTVDEGIKKHLQPELKQNDWDLLIAHFLGVDHCGHRYGPLHPEMTRKLDEMNTVISEIVESMDNSTVLVVLGDHGMTNTGDHGGESEAEVTAALFIYSPLGLLPQSWSPKGGVVRQVDLVPTLATILGIPIPFSNLGSVIIDSLPKTVAFKHVGSTLQNWQFALLSLWSNVRQAMTYIETYSSRNNEFTSDKLLSLRKAFSSISEKVKNIANQEEFLVIVEEGSEFLTSLRVLCEKVWVQFDTYSMTWGLIFTFVVIMVIFLVIEALQGDEITFGVSGSCLSFAYVCLVLCASVSLLLGHLSIIQNSELVFFISTFGSSFVFLAIVLAANTGAILSKWGNISKSKSWLELFWRTICMLSLWAMASNSYVIAEGQILSFFLLSLIATMVYCYNVPLEELSGVVKNKISKSRFAWIRSQIHPMRLRTITVAFALAILVRATHQFWKCRDEESGCNNQLPSEPSEPKKKDLGADPNCLIMLVCMALWVTFTRMWLRSCGNLTGYSITVLFARYTPTVMAVCSGGFWVLQGLPGDTRSRLFKPWQLQILPWTVYTLSGVSLASLIWRPLCVFVVKSRNQSPTFSVTRSENPIPQLYNQMKQMIGGKKENLNQNDSTSSSENSSPVVYGLATVYSASFVVLAVILVPAMGLLLGARWSPALVLCACVATCLLLFISILRFENVIVSVQLLATSWPAVVCWSLLAQYAFYGTGHQATFSSIQWDAAMVGTSGNVASSRFVPGLLVIVNTFCSHILMGLLLPLLLIVPLTLRVIRPQWAAVAVGDHDLSQGELMIYQREDFAYRSLTTLTARYILLQGVRSLACMFSATIHARHLMVWAIFAPKFIFEAVSLFVTLPCVLFSFAFVGRITASVESLVNYLDPSNSKPNKSFDKRR